MRQCGNQSGATGPKTQGGKAIASQNSVKHGLFSKIMKFETPDEEAEFRNLYEELNDAAQPTNRLKAILVEEIAVCRWKQRVVFALLERAMHRRENDSIQNTIRHFLGKSDALKLPVPGIEIDSSPQHTGSDGNVPGSPGWECNEMVLRISNDEREQIGTPTSSGRPIKKIEDASTERYELQLRMSDSIDTLLRYETKLKRDMYRAIEQLNRLRELETH